MRKIISDFLRKRKALLLGNLYKGLKTNVNDRYSYIALTEDNPWLITGASVTGHGHHINGDVCQDAHHAEVWNNGWGVAAVSDGAGSAPLSHISSRLLVKAAAQNARMLAEQKGWPEKGFLPTEEQWAYDAVAFMHRMQESVFRYAARHVIAREELHATLIVVIFSPLGLLVTHIGDGRAGCLDKKGNYHSLITPWEGEEAGQTVFVTSARKHFDKIVGSSVFPTPADAFFLLTDGAEKLAWQTRQKNIETGLFESKNEPYHPFWDQTIGAISNMHKALTPEQTGLNWYNYLHNGHKALASEPDDKTIVTGIFSDHSNQSDAY